LIILKFKELFFVESNVKNDGENTSINSESVNTYTKKCICKLAIYLEKIYYSLINELLKQKIIYLNENKQKINIDSKELINRSENSEFNEFLENMGISQKMPDLVIEDWEQIKANAHKLLTGNSMQSHLKLKGKGDIGFV